MTDGRRAPGPVIALAVAVLVIAFSADHPLIVLATLVGAVALAVASPISGRLLMLIAALAALGVVVLNPFVQANGDLILFELPSIPILDTQVTLEEVIAGLVLGARAAAVTITVMAALALVDGDRLLGLASRLLPRSALAASVAARLVPTLRRDATALVETSRLRGRSLTSGPWRRRARTAGTLAVPLVGSALERSVDVAEAMAARGYGSGPRTRTPAPGWAGPDRLIAVTALILAPIAALTVAARVGSFRFYPRIGEIITGPEVVAACVVALVLTVAAAAAAR